MTNLLPFLLALFAVGYCENIRFRISGSHLPDTDKRRTLDPYIRVFYAKMIRGRTMEMSLGKTRYVVDNDSPKWDKIFQFNYRPGTGQTLHLKLYDKDLVMDDFVDHGYVNMDEYMKQGQYAVVYLKHGRLYVCGF